MSNRNGVWLLEVDVYTNPGTTTLYFGSKTISTSPTDTPANVIYQGRISDAGQLQRSLSSNGSIIGKAGSNYGYIELSNADFALDVFFNYAFDGRPFVLKWLDNPDDPVSTAETVFTGTFRGVDSSNVKTTIRLRIRDLMDSMKLPFLTQTYLGTTTSSGPTAEGNQDVANRLKPQSWGQVAYLAPVLVNAFDLIYQVATNAQYGAIIPQDGGITLLSSSDYTTLAALQAATIAAGHYATCLKLGYFRLGATPAKTVTAICISSNQASPLDSSTVANVALLMLQSVGGAVASNLNVASFSALDSDTAAPVGAYFDSDISILDAVSQVLNSVNAVIYPTALGELKVTQLGADLIGGASAVDTFTDDDIDADVNFQIAANSEGDGLPTYKVTVRYGRVWHTMSVGDLSGSATVAQIAFFGNQYRDTILGDVIGNSVHPNAVPLVFETCITNNSLYALVQAEYWIQLLATRRDYLTISIDMTRAGSIDLNDIVAVDIDRLGYGGGKNFVVIGVTQQFSKRRTILNLWG